MKGVVYNLLEKVVLEQYGEDVWDSLLDSADLDGSYTSLGSYPDEQMFRLVDAAAKALSLTQFEVLRWFGRHAMPLLEQSYPDFFGKHTATLPFVLSLNSIIHPEVRKLYPGADVPVFDFDKDPHGSLLMGYHSERKLCALAQGFIEGAGNHYAETVDFHHLECMHNGDPKCLFRIDFHGTKTIK